MQQTENTKAREYALNLLIQTIADLRSQGRRAYGATLKQELKRRTLGQFDETALGFLRFGDFLRDAEGRKLVSISRSPGGDVEAQLAVSTELDRRPIESIDQQRSVVRKDLWSSFIDWREGMVRLYDKVLDQTAMFPAQESPLDSPIVVEQRRAWASSPDRFVEIEHISMDEQLAWMRDFISHVQNPVAKRLLEEAAAGAHPHVDFARMVKAIPQLGSQWHQTRLSRVSRVIGDWTERNRLQIDILVPSVKAATTEATVRALAASPDEPRLQRLRRLLHRAIDRMSEAELATIQIPIGLLDEDASAT